MKPLSDFEREMPPNYRELIKKHERERLNFHKMIVAGGDAFNSTTIGNCKGKTPYQVELLIYYSSGLLNVR